MGSSRLTFVALALGVSVCGLPLAAPAQDFQTPSHISYAEGSVRVEREGESEEPGPGWVLLPGDRIRTAAGRAEILFPDGSALAVDEYTVLDILDAALLRLNTGRTLLTVSGAEDPSAALRYQLDTPSSSITTEGPGEYRVDVSSFPSGAETDLSVMRGYAVIENERSAVRVRPGEQSTARQGFPPSYPRAFNAARYDPFEQWAGARLDERLGYGGNSSSAQYLPADLQMYGGTFDSYGSWQQEPSYGYVWYPRVAPVWRPYYHGSWHSVPGYGWTWTGIDRWAWPTHHYGRWGHARGRWFWVPGRHWGPAWVSWGAAPGYVGWCPLGFNNRPVFAMSVSVGNRWNGWVAVPRARFGARGAFVHREAVYHRSFETTPFVTQAHAPVAAPRAVPRGARVPGGTRVPGGAMAEAFRQGPGPAANRSPAAQPNRLPLSSSAAGVRRPMAASRNPQQVVVEPSLPSGRSRTFGPGAATPSLSPSSAAAGLPRRSMATPRRAPATESGVIQTFPQRAAPGVVMGPSAGVVNRRPPARAPEPQPAPSSSGVIRTNPNRGSFGAGGNSGSEERARAVRRAPTPALTQAPPAGFTRQAPSRQAPGAAPTRQAATPPAATPPAAAPAASRRGSSSGDSGRARRR